MAATNNLCPSNNKFEGAVLPPTLPERSPQRAVKAGNDRARSAIDQLLFQWADKIELESSPAARERNERSVYSIFRIPTTAKQPSRSPHAMLNSEEQSGRETKISRNRSTAVVVLDYQRTGKRTLIKTTTRQTYFLLVIGLVVPEKLNPGN
ncbi:26S protease regulatory subunit 6a [Culex quinquefasciatus]|uniref:26S protease regulatory subunit 6a n=1 Tax=Culex quinquefasciatus TaxID=7176 RepID=B0X9I2_CULQU|nr:26S protease regulatory subunit 6a [Culex quinquefasciatus]|eukprot:XP_001866304.1 26S protease regulatory subunit 6a [Culex quinquefasciatus]